MILTPLFFFMTGIIVQSLPDKYKYSECQINQNVKPRNMGDLLPDNLTSQSAKLRKLLSLTNDSASLASLVNSDQLQQSKSKSKVKSQKDLE